MTADALLSTIVLVAFLVTILMAIGSYGAYKLRESRHPRLERPPANGDSPFFERIGVAEAVPRRDREIGR